MAQQPEDEVPPTRVHSGVPTDPDEQEAWKAKFLDDLMAGEPGGIGVTWRDGRPQR